MVVVCFIAMFIRYSSRLHITMGDYSSAVEVASSIELSPSALYWKVPAAHVAFFYNLGFAYMMMRQVNLFCVAYDLVTRLSVVSQISTFLFLRRYQDAIRVLSQILTFLGRSRSYLSSASYQQEVMLRTTDRMYHLVLLCNALSPTRLDETIQSYIQDHLADKHFK